MPRTVAAQYDDPEVSALIDPAGVSKTTKAAQMERPSHPWPTAKGSDGDQLGRLRAQFA
jgi:hypothetical protein